MQFVRMDCSCLQTAGESSVSRRLCHANCLNEGLAFDGRNSSKAPISRSSFSLFSDQSGGICLILCRSSLQVPPVVVRLARGFGNWMRMPFLDLGVRFGNGSIELRARTASFKWQVSPLLLYSLPWHRARTEPSRKVSCQSASCRATLFGGSREKCFAFRSRSVDGTEYVTGQCQQ